MRRRTVLAMLGGAAALAPLAARAQQQALPVVGFLRSTPAGPFAQLLIAFRAGLGEAGFKDGENVAIEQRYADNRYDRLPALARDLVDRRAAAIVANGVAVSALRSVTTTVPVVFVSGDDPVKSGLVSNLSRPDGNVTGITFFGGGQLNAKRLELLHELIPAAASVAVLLDTGYPPADAVLPDAVAAARALGRRVDIVKVASEREFESAFARIGQAGARGVLVSGSPVFTSRRRELVAIAARHGIPAIYDQRDFVAAGGLISYGASFAGAYRQAGVYVGRILKGARPSELPVVQPTTFELAVNLATARALGLTLPPSLLARADEVIE